MTNRISELSLSFMLITNWTGHIVGGNELGYVATNHNLSWQYESNNFVHTMKTVPSEIAVWRQRYVWNGTNFPDGIIITNYGIFTLPAIPKSYGL